MSVFLGINPIKEGLRNKGILTISCGISAFALSNKKQKWETILNSADIALYKAKSSGKNRVCDSEE
jgi:PleD family two-component response regulator